MISTVFTLSHSKLVSAERDGTAPISCAKNATKVVSLVQVPPTKTALDVPPTMLGKVTIPVRHSALRMPHGMVLLATVNLALVCSMAYVWLLVLSTLSGMEAVVSAWLD